jgi:hypothetical protein
MSGYVLQKHQQMFTSQSGLHQNSSFFSLMKVIFVLGYALMLLVKALRYKLEDRGFDFRWCHWNFSLN